MKELLILLNPGHGNDTPGKRWTFNGITFYEWQYNRMVMNLVAKELDTLGIKYRIITTEDNDVSLSTRAIRVNRIAAEYGRSHCLLFSIHSNASANHNARGFSLYTSRGKTESDAYAEIGYEQAKISFKDAKLLHDMSDGDHDFEAGFYMVTKTICPAVLVEAFFYDNQKDFEYLLSEKGKKEIVNWYVETIKKCVEYHKNK